MRESCSRIPDMQTPLTTDSRIAEFAKLLETKGDIASLQKHLKEVIEGDAFKGSHRSGQFLQYIIDQSIAGHFDSLKERVIGMELFGRSPSYDTGDDAIVRVTASEVRRRLLQHYGTNEQTSGFRLSLPLGSYIPEIKRRSSNRSDANAESLQEDRAQPAPTPLVQAQVSNVEEPAANISTIPTHQNSGPTWLRAGGWLLAC